MKRAWVFAVAGLASFAIVVTSAGSALAGTPSVAEVTGVGKADAADVIGKRDVRSIALDRALADAVRRQVSRELTVTERRRVQDGVARDIVRRARIYVRSYKVARERKIEGGVELTIKAVVDRDKLLGAIAKLGIIVDTSRPARRARGSRPAIALLVHASRASTVDTTFGQRGGTGGPSGAALQAQLRALGFDLVSAAGTSAPASTDAQADLPVGDSAAIALARRLGAGGVVVVGIDVSDDGRIRATPLRGAAGRAAVRVLDVASGKVIVSARLDAAGVGATTASALDTAAAMLGRQVGERIGVSMARRWPSSIAAPRSGRLVVVEGATRWASVAAIIKRLRAVPGTRGVVLHQLREGSVAMVVDTSLSPAQLAAQIGRVALPLGTAAARLAGDQIEISVDGDQAGSD